MTDVRAATLVLLAVVATSAPAATPHVLTVGKVARFENRGDAARNGGVVTIGRDRLLATLLDPRCPGTSTVEVEAYLQSTFRDAVLAHVDLDCTKWSAKGAGYRYADPSGTVRAIRYGRDGLRIEVRGAGFTPIAGPVGFVQAQLQVGDEVLRARFHNFKRNDAGRVVSRKPSAAAAAGEAGFWDALSGDASSEADEQRVVRNLTKAVRRDPRDGRSHFLLAMIHLYRFGQQVTRFDDVSAAARADLDAANAAFASALPLLWDEAHASGDSRVPGFAAAAAYLQGIVTQDAARRAQGLADLRQAVEINTFFNVFDYIPVLQAVPADDPDFVAIFPDVNAYLSDPATIQCVISQPEICGNAGFAPRNIFGSLTLFGDLFAKVGNQTQAQFWYSLAGVSPDTATWVFKPALDDRVANLAQRIALYGDSDPTNDPPIIGAGTEACAVCHKR